MHSRRRHTWPQTRRAKLTLDVNAYAVLFVYRYAGIGCVRWSECLATGFIHGRLPVCDPIDHPLYGDITTLIGRHKAGFLRSHWPICTQAGPAWPLNRHVATNAQIQPRWWEIRRIEPVNERPRLVITLYEKTRSAQFLSAGTIRRGEGRYLIIWNTTSTVFARVESCIAKPVSYRHL